MIIFGFSPAVFAGRENGDGIINTGSWGTRANDGVRRTRLGFEVARERSQHSAVLEGGGHRGLRIWNWRKRLASSECSEVSAETAFVVLKTTDVDTDDVNDIDSEEMGHAEATDGAIEVALKDGALVRIPRGTATREILHAVRRRIDDLNIVSRLEYGSFSPALSADVRRAAFGRLKGLLGLRGRPCALRSATNVAEDDSTNSEPEHWLGRHKSLLYPRSGCRRGVEQG